MASLYGLGARRPWLAWPMTIAMLSLAGFPVTAGFFGKLFLIRAAAENGYTWLGVLIVVGSAISLAYYLRVIAAVWMRSPSDAIMPAPTTPAAIAAGQGGVRPAIAGGSPEADEPVGRRLGHWEVTAVAVICAAATIAFGIYPEPLFDVARDAGAAFANLV
jgi:NADH-quinone oxidoreductase subunit N